MKQNSRGLDLSAEEWPAFSQWSQTLFAIWIFNENEEWEVVWGKGIVGIVQCTYNILTSEILKVYILCAVWDFFLLISNGT